MPKITNHSRETLNFHIGGFDKNGEPNMGHVRAGETENLSVNLEDPQVKGRIAAGLITVEAPAKKAGASKAKSKAKAPATPAGAPATEPTT